MLLHPSVADAVVIGANLEPDCDAKADTSKRIKAVVVCKQSCSEQELVNWCRDRLANYKVPSLIQFNDQIPKSPLGKVLRKNLA